MKTVEMSAPPPYDPLPVYMVQVEGPTKSTFDRDNPRYRCCCHGMHVTTGLKILAVLLCIGTALNLLSAFITIGVSASGKHTGNVGSSIIQLLAIALVAFTVIMALRKEKPGWLIPYLICLGISIATITICVLVFVVLAFAIKPDQIVQFMEGQGGQVLDPEKKEMVKSIFGIGIWIMTFFLALFLGIQIWIFSVVMKSYRFYKDLDANKWNTAGGCRYNMPGAGMP